MGSPKQLIPRPRDGAVQRGHEQVVLPAYAAWTVLLVSMLCRAALYTGVALALWTLLPLLFGFTTTTVMSGSMMPDLRVGDAVVVHHVDRSGLRVGQVLLVDDPDHPGELRLHRLNRIEPNGVVLKGDANADPDSTLVRYSAIKGAGFLRIPFAGLPYYWLRTHAYLQLGALTVSVLILSGGVGLGRMLQDPSVRVRRRHRGPRLPGVHRAVAAGLGIVVLGALAVQPASSYASYASTTSNSGNSFTTTGFDCPTRGTLPASAWSYFNYMEPSGSTTTDRTGNGRTGTLTNVTRDTGTCTAGASPSVTLGSGGASLIVAAVGQPVAPPTAVTIATWFRVPTGKEGGIIADFGSSNTTTASTSVGDALFMTNSGTLSFGVQTTSVLGALTAPVQCTTTGTDFADNTWHYVAATFATGIGGGCTVYVGNSSGVSQAVTQSAPTSVNLLGSYTGYWRFGSDTLPTLGLWSNGPTTTYLRGDLDETAVFTTALNTTDLTALAAIGH